MHRFHTWLFLLAGILATGAIIGLTAFAITSPPATFAAPLAQSAPCRTPGLEGSIDASTTLSGENYITGRVRIVNGATLTLEPGTTLIFCGEFDLLVGDLFEAGALVSNGTADNPVTVRPDLPDGRWGKVPFALQYSTITTTSVLRHTIFINGGGSTPDQESGVLEFTGDSPGDGPVVDNVTIRGSSTHGIYHRTEDQTPAQLSNLTITGSAREPILIFASSVGSISGTNVLTGNAVDAIRVGTGTVLAGSVSYTQTWRNHNVPYHIDANFGGPRIGDNATLTLEPGVQIGLPAEANLTVDTGAALVAEGTPDQRIGFFALDPAQQWGRIQLGTGSATITTTLRYADLRDGGAPRDAVEAATLEIRAPDGTPAGLLIDHVSIRNSGTYGLFARVAGNDDTPLSLSNLTITGSAQAPIGLYVAAARGLGGGNTLSGNARDTIDIWTGTVLGGRMDFSQQWVRQPVPFYLRPDFGGLRIGDGATLRIDAGNTLLMSETMGIEVQSGRLLMQGTASAPITMTRVSDASGAWGTIFLGTGNQGSEFSHTRMFSGGDTDATVVVSEGAANFSHVTIRNSPNAGVRVRAPFVSITDSELQLNRIGVLFQFDGNGAIRRSTIANNTEGGVIAEDNRGLCIDAIGNFWGTGDGPADTDATADACNSTATNDGSGNAVSANVQYAPFLTGSDGGVADNSRIDIADLWVIADGVQTTTVTVRLRDQQGMPLVGKTIALSTTRGTLTGPISPTDATGIATAIISSTTTGDALITGYNITDDQPLAAIGAIVFWQGRGDFGGLISPNGAPFDSPALLLEGRPFEAGRPISFRVPMQNTRSVPLSVTVSYAETALNIGGEFRPVDVVNRVLQPGETWDAAGGYTPLITGHSCVQARIEYTPLGTTIAQGGGGILQVNRDNRPSTDKRNRPPKLSPGLFSPNPRKRYKETAKKYREVTEFLDVNLSFQTNAALAQHGDFTVIATPPTYTPISFPPDADITPELSQALNAVSAAAADVGELGAVLLVTRGRLEGATQAEDFAAAGQQLAAYRDYKAQYATALDLLADRLEALAAAYQAAGEPDATITVADFEQYRETLRTTGYPPELVNQFRNAGLNDALIEALRQDELATLDAGEFAVMSFYADLRDEVAALRADAAALRERYASISTARLAQGSPNSYRIDPVTSSFVVANPTDSTATVNLLVRPAGLPINWSYSLDHANPELAAGATTTVTLNLSPGDAPVIEDAEVRVAVEGYINGELVGGVLVQQRIPAVPATEPTRRVYLPLIVRAIQ